MKIRFKIQYSTQWGEILHVVATYKTKGGNNRSHNVQMKTSDGISWYAEASVVNSSTDPVITFSYHYQVEDVNGKVKRQECNKISRTYPYDGSKDYLLSDEWSDVPLQNHLYSKAYEYIVKRTEEKSKTKMSGHCHTIIKLSFCGYLHPSSAPTKHWAYVVAIHLWEIGM